MLPIIHYQALTIERIPEAAAFVRRVFDEFVAWEFSEQGRHSFYRFITPPEFQRRMVGESFAILALDGETIAGMIEMRHQDHIALLFVERAYQGQGIARELFRQALKKTRTLKPDLQRVTVNSSPFAVTIYEKLGFTAIDSEQERDGIRFTPMQLDL
jgi:GNAT superfamily N-acetyltransferase